MSDDLRQRCPTCAHGVLAREERSIDPYQPNFRSFTCGHRVEHPDVQATRVRLAVESGMASDEILNLMEECRG